VPGRVLSGIRKILARRSETREFHAGYPTEVLQTGNAALFAHARRAPAGSVVCVYNFTDVWTAIPASWVVQHGASQLHEILSDSDHRAERRRGPPAPLRALWIR
jgi:amylosucrase